MTKEDIGDLIADLMMDFGPDGHVDGHRVIANFVFYLQNGAGDEWAERYKKNEKDFIDRLERINAG